MVMERVGKDNIEFISLQFTDLVGVIKEVIIPVKELDHALTHGIWFDGSSIEGFARIQESDLFLKPDPNTYAVVPWLTENGRTARLICDIHSADGSEFEGDPRFILKKQIRAAAEAGYRYNVGPEPEFYLFRDDGVNKHSPLDYGGYFDLTSHDGYRIIKEIIAALKSFDIDVETSHHEVGRGQYEVDFNYGHCLEIADKVLTLKYAVKKIAQMHNLHATFIAKPVMDAPGSGMHIHQSLFDMKTEHNAFFDENDRYKLSRIAYSFIAGQMENIKSLCAILCPTVNSYKRLVSGFEAPVYITWASMNRSALIRVPRWFQDNKESARIELRCPDATSNPYLAFAVMLRAGLHGIENNLTPPPPMEMNVYQFDSEAIEKQNISLLPISLREALDELQKNEIIRETLGVDILDKYVDIKTREWNEFIMQVTDWEIDKYINIY